MNEWDNSKYKTNIRFIVLGTVRFLETQTAKQLFLIPTIHIIVFHIYYLLLTRSE